MARPPQELFDFSANLARSARDQNFHLAGTLFFKGSHHQRLSLYQAKVRLRASSRSCSGAHPRARTLARVNAITAVMAQTVRYIVDPLRPGRR